MKKKYLSLQGVSSLIDNIKKILDTKRDVPNIVNDTGSTLLLADNTEYHLTNVSSLSLSYPEGSFEVWMNISFSSTETITVTFPINTKYIGAAPSFGNGQIWEISIKNGVAVCWRVQ